MHNPVSESILIQSATLQRSRLTRYLLALFVAAILLLHAFRPEVHILSQGISYYALGRFGWLFTMAMLFLGTACLVIVRQLWSDSAGLSGTVGILLLLAWTLLMIAGSLFAMDAPGTGPTLSGKIHSLAGLSFLLNPPAALLIEISLLPRQSLPNRRLRWLTAWAVLVASILLLVFNGFVSHLGNGGLVQRLYWLTIVAWLFLLSDPSSQLDQSCAP